MVTKRDDDDDRQPVNIEQFASGRLEGRVLQHTKVEVKTAHALWAPVLAVEGAESY